MRNELRLSGDELAVVQQLLRQTADANMETAQAAMHQLAKAVELPLRKGFFIGDTVGQIYEREDLPADAAPKYPLDFVGPSGERDFAAYYISEEGALPERKVTGKEITIDTFQLGNTITWNLRYARVARWPMVERALRIFRDGFVMKVNDEGWRVLIGAAANRQDGQYASVGSGAFTMAFLSDMQLKMKRGIDFARNELTDLYVSSEVQKDIRDFATGTTLDFITRNEIFNAVAQPDGNGAEILIPRLYGVNVHELKQLGVGRDYASTMTDVNGNVSLWAEAADEFVIGLDLTPEGKSNFVMPVRRDLEMFEDMSLHKQQLAGVYGWMELAFGVLDDRRVLFGHIDAT
jgi:hypothetical protein